MHAVLDFCAEHGIAFEGETIPAVQCNRAWDWVTGLVVHKAGSQTV